MFGVEMFLLEDGEILLNEVAPRPHNSGHYTIEGCATSQFEQHLRAVMGWPLGSPDLIVTSWCAPDLSSPAMQHSNMKEADPIIIQSSFLTRFCVDEVRNFHPSKGG